MNELTIYNNPDFGGVRAMEIGGEPWFVGKDIAEVLGYQNPSKALSDHVDEEDKLNNETLSSLGQRGGVPFNVQDVARRIRKTSDPQRVLAQLRLSLAESCVQDIDDSQ